MNRFVLAVVASFLCAGVAQAQVTEEDLANDATSVGDVLTNGMGRGLQRFSPLETLNRENIDKLEKAIASGARLGDGPTVSVAARSQRTGSDVVGHESV